MESLLPSYRTPRQASKSRAWGGRGVVDEEIEDTRFRALKRGDLGLPVRREAYGEA
jgi:hypothetical protein